MSGVDVASLILGTILGLVPVIELSIDRYKRGLPGREMRHLDRCFRTQRIIFTNTVEELLAPLVSDAELVELLDRPGGTAWQACEQLTANLKDHLGKMYDPFLEIIVDIRDMMFQLEKILAPEDLNSRKVGKQIKMFLSRSRGEVGLERLTARIEDLDTLKNQSHGRANRRRPKVVQAESGRRKNIDPETYVKVQERALSLYEALSRGWQCDCETPHHANLRLEARRPSIVEAPQVPQTDKPSSTGSVDNDDVRFKFLFSFTAEQNKGEQPLALDWREAELAPLNPQLPLRESKGNDQGEGVNSRPVRPAKAKASKPKRITFESPKTHNPTRLTSQEGEHEKGKEDRVEIKDLCNWIQSVQDTRPEDQDYLGYLSDATNETQYGLYRVNSRKLEPPLASIHVGELLSPSRGWSDKGPRLKRQKLSPRRRYEVAFTLGTTVLQLHSTPWLDRWAKQDILYLPDSRNDVEAALVEPYISRRFPSCKSPDIATSDSDHTNAERCIFVPNATLFTLCVVLIEIAYNKPIEALAIPSDITPMAIVTAQLTARRISKQIQRDMGEKYQRAVEGCLDCKFGLEPLDTNLGSIDFRRAFAEHVVEPLEQCTEFFVS